jgi:hypothetical protein
LPATIRSFISPGWRARRASRPKVRRRTCRLLRLPSARGKVVEGAPYLIDAHVVPGYATLSLARGE